MRCDNAFVSTRGKELEQRLARAEQELNLLQRISRLHGRDLPLSGLLRDVVALVVEFMACDSCLLYLRDSDRLVLCASNVPRPETIGTVSLHLNEGLTGWVARERRLLAISREAFRDSRFKFFRDLPEDTFEAFLSVPILARNQVMGVINVQHRPPHAHTGAEMEMLTAVGEQVGALVVAARVPAGVLVQADYAELALPGRLIEEQPR